MTVADAKAALERGRPIVLVRPPAAEQAGELWELLQTPGHGPGVGPPALVICADDASAAEWPAVAPAGLRVHAVTGLARTVRILKERPVDVLAGSAKDLAALLERAALKLDQVGTVVVAWPEALLADERGTTLDTILAEAPDAHRIVLSWQPAALGDFLERHARRALVTGPPPVDDAGRPLPPTGPARYAVAHPARRAVAVRDALDALSATRPFIWAGGAVEPPVEAPDAVLGTVLPTREEFAALSRLGTPVLLVTAAQLPYLRSIATATPLALPSAADRARDRTEALRERVALLLTAANLDGELAVLDPLFERFDPAEVAAALLVIAGEKGRAKGEATAPPLPADSGRVTIFVNVGKKDRAAAKDLVGALIREVGVAKGDIGRVEVRETFSLVELAAGAAARAVRGLSGITIRGRRVLARLDRQA